MMCRRFQMAVTTIALYRSPVPHLISGPPGTGKTRLPIKFNFLIFLGMLKSSLQDCR
jgi:hypothetical protein